jgi:S-formylglutathione hydrolase
MLTKRSEQLCFGGTIGFYAHDSTEIGAEMRFSVYVPPQAAAGPRPVLYYLAGLTCTEETFMIKAGAQRLAAELGLILVAPDTSPRGLGLPGEEESWDFGTGAGFYLDAEAAPWSTHYRMYSYVVLELPDLIETNFPALPDRRAIFGHSMGGHGALVIALRNPDRYRSVSAFAPIANPVAVPWGRKAFGNYLGSDESAGRHGMRACSCGKGPFRATSWSIKASPTSSSPVNCILKRSPAPPLRRVSV